MAAQLWHPQTLWWFQTGEDSQRESARKLCADILTNPRLVSLMLPVVYPYFIAFTAETEVLTYPRRGQQMW